MHHVRHERAGGKRFVSRRVLDVGCSIGKTAAICEMSCGVGPLRSGLTRSTVLAAVRGTAHATIILKIKLNNPQIGKI
ncbi:hypothetical protein CDC59_22870 (plasmid) [Ralstonia solanacearum]|nr:hypothetical protein CDC59_22870 [Ralstonia solanacearum]